MNWQMHIFEAEWYLCFFFCSTNFLFFVNRLENPPGDSERSHMRQSFNKWVFETSLRIFYCDMQCVCVCMCLNISMELCAINTSFKSHLASVFGRILLLLPGSVHLNISKYFFKWQINIKQVNISSRHQNKR